MVVRSICHRSKDGATAMSGSTRATSEINGVACKHPSNKLTCMFCCSISIMGGVGAGGVMETWKCALCCFCSQRSIRPQVVTTFELPGCHDMWTVISNEVKEDKKVLQSPRSLTATRYSLSQSFFFYLQNGVSPLIHSQAAKSSSESDDVAETDREEDGEEGKKEQDETEKEEKEKENAEPPSEEDIKKHGFLILSREDSTMVDRHVLHAAA